MVAPLGLGPFDDGFPHGEVFDEVGFGQRRTFIVGLTIFSLASIAIGAARSAEWMPVARALQGVESAILAPATLALLTESFTEGRERTTAGATRGGDSMPAVARQVSAALTTGALLLALALAVAAVFIVQWRGRVSRCGHNGYLRADD